MIEKIPSQTIQESETKQKPQIKLWLTRHANRAPSGELVPEGIAKARDKGERVDAEVLKGYSSLEKTDRAYKTLQLISEGSGIKSPETEELYQTRRREGLYYDITGPLEIRVRDQSKIINEAVKRDYPDFDPKSSDPKWAEIRERYQPIGIRNLVADEEMVQIFAMGAGYQFFKMSKIAERYVRAREGLAQKDKAKPIEKDIILNEGTHSVFIESLFKRALLRVQPDGSEKRGFDIYKDENGNVQFEKAMNDLILPTESIRTAYPLGEKIPDRLPIEFERERFKGEKCYLDMSKIEKLADQFEVYLEQLGKWKKGEIEEKGLVSAVNQLRKEFEE